MESLITHTILIVDDNPDDIEITHRALTKTGRMLEIVSALRGEEALDYLRSIETPPSLVLLDLKMPGMGGIETLRQIRDDRHLQKVPVVIVTSSSLESDRKESLEAGANSFLHKHFDLDQFVKELDDLLERWLKN